MINNFVEISKLIKFDSEDDFYFMQIIKRKKEHPELGNNSLIIKSYYIKSESHFLALMGEIICLCDYHNARASICLNKRSFKQIAFQTLRKISEQLLNESFKTVKSAYDSCCGMYNNEKEKKWIIDVDEKSSSRCSYIYNEIYNVIPEGNKIYLTLSTKNGYHLITKPFNTIGLSFKEDIKKDNFTNLYTP